MLKVTARKLSFDDRTGSILNRMVNSSGQFLMRSRRSWNFVEIWDATFLIKIP